MYLYYDYTGYVYMLKKKILLSVTWVLSRILPAAKKKKCVKWNMWVEEEYFERIWSAQNKVEERKVKKQGEWKEAPKSRKNLDRTELSKFKLQKLSQSRMTTRRNGASKIGKVRLYASRQSKISFFFGLLSCQRKVRSTFSCTGKAWHVIWILFFNVS